MINTQKRGYTAPAIQVVNLDNEISLQLTSPTYDPEEVHNISEPEYITNDPYKMV